MTILFVSRISIKKNLKLLVEAVAQSANKQKFLIEIIGGIEDKVYFEEIEWFLKKHHIAYNYRGAVPPHLLQDYYQKAQVFCLPTWHENYGHVIAEALSYGLPVVISEHTPWRNLKEKGVGFDLPLDAASFAKALDEIFELSDEAYLEMRKRARAFAETVLLNPEVEKANRALFLEKIGQKKWEATHIAPLQPQTFATFPSWRIMQELVV
jgi:glycosyltransferase involved in cell wall biosynthesis